MNRSRVYVLVIAILLLSNLALVGFFVMNKPGKQYIHKDSKPGSFMREALKKDVGFNDDQMARFDQMAEAHRQQMRPLFEDITKTKENFYHLLTQPATPDSVLNKAAKQIGEKQQLIDLRIFLHFQNIRQLCTTSQQPDFDSLILHVVHRMISPMHKPDSKGDSSAIKK